MNHAQPQKEERTTTQGEDHLPTDLREQPSCRRGPAARFWASLPWSQMPPSPGPSVDVLSAHGTTLRREFRGNSDVAGNVVHPGEALADEDRYHRKVNATALLLLALGILLTFPPFADFLQGK